MNSQNKLIMILGGVLVVALLVGYLVLSPSSDSTPVASPIPSSSPNHNAKSLRVPQ